MDRDNWKKLINRADNKNHLWNPSKDSRVCSLHFVDGKPTPLNADKRATLLSPPSGKRKRKLNLTLEVEGKKRKSTENLPVPPKAAHSESTKHHAAEIVYEETSEQCASDYFNLSSQIIDSGDNPLENFEGLDDQKQHYEATIKSLNEKINSLEIQVHNLETKLNQPMYEKLLASDEKCTIYTNIDKVELFNVLHSKIAPLIRRRFDYVKDQETRRFKTTPKKFGPDTKLESKDEFLLTLMKLRLGLLGKDIAHRFGISNTLCTQIFHSWIRGMAEYFRSFVFMPDIETILATTPKRYRHFENLIGIIDCSEIFMETPKNLEVQSATWSEYKHHNTLKFLVCVAPNSAITFVSKGYTGRISDKEITLKYLK